MKPFLAAVGLGLSLLAAGVSAASATISEVTTDHAVTRLVPELAAIAPGDTLALALAQRLEPGWHVYWENPGDSGLPLEMLWALADGAVAAPVAYPAPHRIAIGPLINFGHEGDPVFLTGVTVPGDAVPGTDFTIGLEATWLICADICVPETGRFSLSVPIAEKSQRDDSAASLFSRARAAMPEIFNGPARYSVDGKKARLALTGFPAGDDAYFFPSQAGASEPSAAQRSTRVGDALVIDFTQGVGINEGAQNLTGVVEIDTKDGRRALQIDAVKDAAMTIEAAAPVGPATAAPIGAGGGSLAGFIAAAFLGGVILNLMPCVFPILFVKAASFANAASSDKGVMRRHGLAYAAGVIASFAALGGALIALRAGGEEIGWGFHLQSPAIVLLSAYILFAVALNLAGVFHIGSSLQNVGSEMVAGRNDDFSAFLTGVLAVLVAAPCVGPFLTAPIGAAAVLPPLPALSIFLALGAGLAAPFVALAFSPGLARALPKPGPWMVRFRTILAFPVFAAAAYFLWVLSAQTGQRGLALALAGAIVIAAAARLHEWGRTGAVSRVAALLFLAAAALPLFLVKPAEAAAPAGMIAFDPADIDARRAAGEPVFVDFTAAWCVTCQVNKLTVLSTDAVKTAFAANGVTVVTADWTNRDPVIEQALAAFGANGVPLYVFYPAGAEPVVLAQPLTVRSLLATLSPEGS